jgi:ATP-binding cassette, subfamily B, bacterial CvaB/MchF/RaxB
METVRGILPIKLFGREMDRQRLWQNRFAESINAGVKLGRLRVVYTSANGLLFGIENVLIVYLAARMVLEGNFTVGMIFAFMAYKRHFISNATALVEKAIEFRMLGLHLERIADIATTDPELQPAGMEKLSVDPYAEITGALMSVTSHSGMAIQSHLCCLESVLQ